MDSRARAMSASGVPGWMASDGAAMWMPMRQPPPSFGRTEKASSISVVVASSIEKARTPASGSSPTGGTSWVGKSVPFGKYSNRKRPR